MAGFFNYDNKLMTGLNKIFDSMCVSMLWVGCSLPIFTIGASTTALYYAVNKSIRHNRGYAWKEFLSAFKSNFKQSTVVWLFTLLCYAIGVADCYILYQLNDTMSFAKVLLAIIIALVLILTMWMLYVFPYMARFALPTKALMKNALIIMLANFKWTILLLLLFVVSMVGSLFLAVLAMFVPVVYMVIANLIIERVFRKYMSEEDIEAEEERNRVEYN